MSGTEARMEAARDKYRGWSDEELRTELAIALREGETESVDELRLALLDRGMTPPLPLPEG